MTGNAMIVPKLYAAFGSRPLVAAPVWTDITSRLRGAAIRRRLGDEGTCRLILNNRDRALEPEYASSAYYPNVVPNVRLRLVADAGNILEVDTASAERGLGNIAPARVTGRTMEQAADGVWSFYVDRAGVGNATVTTAAGFATMVAGEGYACVAGDVRTVMASFRGKTVGAACTVEIWWYNSSLAFISSSTPGNVTSVTGSWSQASITVTAPAGAVWAVPAAGVAFTTAVDGERHYVDKLGLFAGTVTTWVHGAAPVFDGFVDSWTPQYRFGASGGDAWVEVVATDVTKVLARYAVRPPYEVEVAADLPVHWWPLGEVKGSTVVGDRGSAPATGTYAEGALLGEPPVAAASTATALRSWTGAAAEVHFPAVTGNWTVEFVIDSPVEDVDGNTIQEVLLLGPVLASIGMEPASTSLVVGGLIAGQAAQSQISSKPLPARRVVAVTRTADVLEVFMNGVTKGSVDFAGFTLLPLSRLVVGNVKVQGLTDTGVVTAVFGHVAVYGSVLSPTRLLAHAAEVSAPWAADSTGARVSRLLVQVGVPSVMRDVEAGATTGLAALREPVEGKTALDLARQAERTEVGRMFAAADGKWAFRSRRTLAAQPVMATFGDGGGTEVPYASLSSDYTEAGVVNRATVTRDGGNPQTYTDPALLANDPIFAADISDVLYATDGEAFDAAAWLVTQGRTPHLRFPTLQISGERSSTVMDQVSLRDIGDKVTVLRRPPGGGSAQTRTVVVDGVAHDVDVQRRSWPATYDLSPVDPVTYWILEDSVYGLLGTTTVLAF